VVLVTNDPSTQKQTVQQIIVSNTSPEQAVGFIPKPEKAQGPGIIIMFYQLSLQFLQFCVLLKRTLADLLPGSTPGQTIPGTYNPPAGFGSPGLFQPDNSDVTGQLPKGSSKAQVLPKTPGSQPISGTMTVPSNTLDPISFSPDIGSSSDGMDVGLSRVFAYQLCN
jgi:hypothetical protein